VKHSIAPSASESRILDLSGLPEVSVTSSRKDSLLYSIHLGICAYSRLWAMR
jgi:hypothetical protein